ncbi:MAG: TetR/AcrR family transcriptional regulator [Acidimicrobiales bacterium]
MSPKPADPAVRTALLETAAHLIATEGLGKLTLRRLASEVGTSTMAVYTHFGGMDELRRAVRREGFARLGAHLSAVERTNDPVADYIVLGWAYYTTGAENPDLYRAMFMDGPVDEADAGMGVETFEQCVAAVQRCIDAGRFSVDNAVDAAMQQWAMMHGIVSLQIAHLVQPAEALGCLTKAIDVFTAYGDDRRALGRSRKRAFDRIAPIDGRRGWRN